MDDVTLAALIIFVYGLTLVAVLTFGRSAMRNRVIGRRTYQAFILTFAVVAAMVIRIAWANVE